MMKPKVAVCWFGGCGGCDETVLDINEEILNVVENFEMVLWPVALDFKYESIERMDEGSIFCSIINGSVRNSEHEELAKLLRRKSNYVVAFGACACFGGTPSLANLTSKDEIFKYVYREAPTVVNPERNEPKTSWNQGEKNLSLPEFYDYVVPLFGVIDVDYFVPGCPPSPDLVKELFNVLLSGDLPPKGSTLAPSVSLCGVCKRNDTKPEKLEITSFKRIHEVEADQNLCFLLQGILCLGPSTRSGCGTVCIEINIPCRGCMGPTEGVKDLGSKYLSMIASLLEAKTEEERVRLIESLEDPVGYFYRFTLGSSLGIRRRKNG